MAILNRPLTIDEIEFLLKCQSILTLPGFWRDIVEGPYRHQTVRYRAALDRVDYERRDTFYALGPKSPSDCVWIVPGAWQ